MTWTLCKITFHSTYSTSFDMFLPALPIFLCKIRWRVSLNNHLQVFSIYISLSSLHKKHNQKHRFRFSHKYPWLLSKLYFDKKCVFRYVSEEVCYLCALYMIISNLFLDTPYYAHKLGFTKCTYPDCVIYLRLKHFVGYLSIFRIAVMIVSLIGWHTCNKKTISFLIR